MKKRMLAIMMSALMAAGICSSVTVYADADSKTLTVGFDAEYPPFGYMDESGEYVGFDLDVAQKVCDNLGKKRSTSGCPCKRSKTWVSERP